MKKKYKINLHILEACNFKCRQCFSKFGTKKLLSVKDWEKIVDNCIAGADVAEFNIAGADAVSGAGGAGAIHTRQRSKSFAYHERLADGRRMD